MGLPALAGWAWGHPADGLMATIGSFTALYGAGRPYLNRAGMLAVVAVAFALAVGLGIAAATVAWGAVLVVAVIATVSTLVCGAFGVGPPGAYMFALACAAGTGMHAEHLPAWHSGLLVLAGGAISWLVHMSGALVRPRGPERSAVASAGAAVADFADAVGTPRQDTARHWAALAIHDSWSALVAFQRVRPRPDGTLARLRGLNRELHVVFAGLARAAADGTPAPPGAAARAREIAYAARAAEVPPGTYETGAAGAAARGAGHAGAAGAVPGEPVASPAGTPLGDAPGPLFGRPGPLTLLREALRPESGHPLTTARVGLAAVLAGSIGAALELDRAYWAVAAAVLVLYQGLDWTRTAQRGLERSVGTWVGLLLAAAVLSAYPTGLWLVLTVALLQTVIELCVLRNYALSAVFITAAALTIASGGRPVADLGSLLLARGVDTLIGCGVALAVFAATAALAGRGGRPERLPAALARTLEEVAAVTGCLAGGAVTTTEARGARRRLQLAVFALFRSYEFASGAAIRRRAAAERLWPAVVAAQALAYRTLGTCWAVEQVGAGGPAAAREVATALYGPHERGATALRAELERLASSLRTGTAPTGPPAGTERALPAVVADEVSALHGALTA
jgi:uncharacterized membrane protein YccC